MFQRGISPACHLFFSWWFLSHKHTIDRYICKRAFLLVTFFYLLFVPVHLMILWIFLPAYTHLFHCFLITWNWLFIILLRLLFLWESIVSLWFNMTHLLCNDCTLFVFSPPSSDLALFRRYIFSFSQQQKKRVNWTTTIIEHCHCQFCRTCFMSPQLAALLDDIKLHLGVQLVSER